MPNDEGLARVSHRHPTNRGSNDPPPSSRHSSDVAPRHQYDPLSSLLSLPRSGEIFTDAVQLNADSGKSSDRSTLLRPWTRRCATTPPCAPHSLGRILPRGLQRRIARSSLLPSLGAMYLIRRTTPPRHPLLLAQCAPASRRDVSVPSTRTVLGRLFRVSASGLRRRVEQAVRSV